MMLTDSFLSIQRMWQAIYSLRHSCSLCRHVTLLPTEEFCLTTQRTAVYQTSLSSIALYTYWWSFPGPTKKMKVAVKGGAAVDPESGTIATLLNLYFSWPLYAAALFFYGQILSSPLFVLLFCRLVLWGLVRAATSLSVVHHLTTDLQSATLVPMRLVPLNS